MTTQQNDSATPSAIANPPKYRAGFEFDLNGEEAMIWSSQRRDEAYGGGAVYIVVIAWSRFTVINEPDLDQIFSNLPDL